MTDPPDEMPTPNLDALYAAVGIEPPTMRRADIAALSGIDPAQSVRWWRAMGFAEVGDDDIAFSTADLAVVQRLRTLLDAGRIADTDILRLARLMGASFSRLVDAQLAVVSEGLAEGRRVAAPTAPTTTSWASSRAR